MWWLLLLRGFHSASTDTALLILTSCTAAVAASLAFQDVGISKIVWFATRSSLGPQAVGLQPKPILFPCTACLGNMKPGSIFREWSMRIFFFFFGRLQETASALGLIAAWEMSAS